jgi:hypothetical protein
MMCCRMFHPTNGRNNFDKHNCDESVISSLRMTELPSAEVRNRILALSCAMLFSY